MESMVAYLMAAMVAWVPLQAHASFESPDETRARYESIARDVAAVAFAENEAPLFSGRDGRLQTALLMLSIASYESSFRKQVDEGMRLGDSGRSFCLMQIRVGTGDTEDGWSGPDLVHDRTLCFRAGLHALHTSFRLCRRFPVEDRVSAYATGRCFENAHISRSRVERARAWWGAHPAPRPDA